MMKELLSIDKKKNNYWEQFLFKTLKISAEISADVLSNLFHDMLVSGP